MAIPKAARVEHVVEIAGAGDLVLTNDEVGKLEGVFPRPSARGALPML